MTNLGLMKPSRSGEIDKAQLSLMIYNLSCSAAPCVRESISIRTVFANTNLPILVYTKTMQHHALRETIVM